jgi:hypothetical protein
MMNKKFSLAIFCVLFSALLFAQREPDKIYMQNIKGVKLFIHGDQLSFPIIKLGATNAVELHFDDLDGNIKNYSYTYQLCNADWKPVDLSIMDYVQGFTQDRLTQYRISSIAKVKYVHYQVLLPDRNIMPTKAGNYLVKVFLNGDTSKLAFTKRLLILNNIVPIGGKVQSPYNGQLFQTHQKVQFSIDKSKIDVFNQQQQLKVVVLQNYRWDNTVTGAQPVFMRGNVYEYNGEQDFLFPAGREFRWVDLRSFRFLSEHIASADRNATPTDVYVRPDASKKGERFIQYQDYDGLFFIDCTDANNPWW